MTHLNHPFRLKYRPSATARPRRVYFPTYIAAALFASTKGMDGSKSIETRVLCEHKMIHWIPFPTDEDLLPSQSASTTRSPEEWFDASLSDLRAEMPFSKRWHFARLDLLSLLSRLPGLYDYATRPPCRYTTSELCCDIFVFFDLWIFKQVRAGCNLQSSKVLEAERVKLLHLSKVAYMCDIQSI